MLLICPEVGEMELFLPDEQVLVMAGSHAHALCGPLLDPFGVPVPALAARAVAVAAWL